MIAHLRATQCGWIWDDDDYVLNNANLRTVTGLYDTWFRPESLPQYYPLVHTTFWLEYQTVGADPRLYHAVNVILHALAAAELWAFLRKVFAGGDDDRGQLADRAAFWAAVIWAVHPMQVEAVAWVTERKNVLSMALAMASANLLWPWLVGKQTQMWRVLMGAAVFLAALLSKTVACALPLVLLLLVWWRTPAGLRRWKPIGLLIAMALLGYGMALITAWLEATHVGATGPEWNIEAEDRLYIAASGIWHYLRTWVWPQGLIFVYPRAIPGVTAGCIAIGAIAITVAVLWSVRKRLGTGLLVAALAFGLIIGPSLGLVNIYPHRYSFVADHFAYHATAALAALTGWLIAQTNKSRWIGSFIALVLATFCWRYMPVFDSVWTLWADVLNRNPTAWVAHLNLAQAHQRESQRPGLSPLEIRQHEREALRLLLLARDVAPGISEVQWNGGVALANEGRLEEAAEAETVAIGLDPNDARPYFALGKIYARRGDVGMAIKLVKKAADLQPGYALYQQELSRLQGATSRPATPRP